MWTHLINSRYTNSTRPLIVLSDSLLQPGSLVLHQLVSSAPPTTRTVWINCDNPRAHSRLQAGQLKVIDCTYSEEFNLSTSSSSTSLTTPIDLTLQTAQRDLETNLVETIASLIKEGGEPVQLVIDGINALEEAFGVDGVWRIVRKGLTSLEKASNGSRFIVLHHDHYPTLPRASTSTSTVHTSLHTSLLSPLLSSSTIHLTLHPPSHLETLSLHYNLTLPHTLDEEESIDLRLTEFLSRARERGFGDPLRRPDRSEEEDERIDLDGLGGGGKGGDDHNGGGGGSMGFEKLSLRNRSSPTTAGGGKAVLQWVCRGVQIGSSSRVGGGVRNGVNSSTQGDKKVVSYGFDGLVRRSASVEVEEVSLGAVLDPRQMGKVRVEAAAASPLIVSPGTTTSSQRPTMSNSASTDTALPFSLSLTPSQVAARSLVANPYEGSNAPIFGELGYTGQMDERPSSGGGGQGLKIEYTPDRGDDLDEEEPDEDLEI